MQDCKLNDIFVFKRDKFTPSQCPKNDYETKKMQEILYTSVVGSFMFAQICTRLDIAYIIGILGIYLSNSRMDHKKAAKRVMHYL